MDRGGDGEAFCSIPIVSFLLSSFHPCRRGILRRRSGPAGGSVMAGVFSYESLVHAVAGAVGSMTAMTVFFPLDTARLRLQVDEKRKSKRTHTVLLEIIKEEGLLAPYRGWFPVISSLCCSNFVYFYTFNSLKAVWVKGHNSTTGKDLILGVVSGIVNVLLTTPLWVVNTRLKLQGAKFRNEDIIPTNYKGIVDAFHQIVRDEGILALWNGTFPSLLLVFNPAIQFMLYEGLKRNILKRQLQLSSLDAFVIGAIAKAIATTLTYPMQTVQSILRFGRHQLNPENKRLGSLKNIMYLLRQRINFQTQPTHLLRSFLEVLFQLPLPSEALWISRSL
ncbi:peroxisomal membrane protein PMP34 isoform X2 [Rhineura floridana]|uniref:peroxisomal membrane protein PMP34 isoform X2 n=1 Tax=Rhineura floridana TaxID=261503 RepID=UPI002AC81C34|nr:peroxisomal membrane protein PMP34 isoform X2 [Rhineura floridana]